MNMYKKLSALFELVLIIGVVLLLWYIMWKFVFESNPEIREFFDLDKKVTKDIEGNKSSKREMKKKL